MLKLLNILYKYIKNETIQSRDNLIMPPENILKQIKCCLYDVDFDIDFLIVCYFYQSLKTSRSNTYF
jgi:hypothetical protein